MTTNASEQTLDAAAHEPIVRAFRCDRAGGRATSVTWRDAARSYTQGDDAEASWLWLHFDRSDKAACDWLHQEAGLSDEVAEALTQDDTRPRAKLIDGGVLLILRSRNRDARSVRDPMVSIRLFITANAVISVRLRPFLPTYQLAASIEAGQAPPSPGAFVGRLVELAMIEIEATLDRLDSQLEALEALAFSAPSGKLRRQRNALNAVRRAALAMRRFMRPQAEALNTLSTLAAELIPPDEIAGLSEAADQAARIADDLDALSESARLVSDEMQVRIAERLNKTMVTLAAVSTVFLPLTFATGLLGVNLAGIPFADSVWAFSGFLVVLAVIASAAILAVNRLNQP